MSNPSTLVPAYGRDYKSKKEVLADFNADKDFIIADMMSQWDGKYVNKSQLSQGTVNIRYKRLTRVLVAKVDGVIEKPISDADCAPYTQAGADAGIKRRLKVN